MNSKSKNEWLKRGYFRMLRQARGYAEATIVAHELAVDRWDEFTGGEDLGKFTANKAVAFKKYLETQKLDGKQLTASSRYRCLKCLQSFFEWLAMQPGFRSKINTDSISYLALDKRTVTGITSPKSSKFPSLEHVKRLASSIEIKTEVDRRDRALIAFLLLSGMRDKAVATLPLGFFDRSKLEIRQDSLKGVETKFGKTFGSHLLVFDDELLKFVLEWAEYLCVQKLFGNTAPLFPRTKVVQGVDILNFQASEVEPTFWRGTGPIRTILLDRAREANLDYYNPHSFRHAHVHLALPFARTAEEVKAISQNLGHEHVGTTLTTYGKLDSYRVGEVIRKMNFKEDAHDILSASDLQALARMVKKAQNKA